jgi:hypothetical protein
MRLLCIETPTNIDFVSPIVKGGIYTKIGEENYLGHIYYELAEHPDHGYMKSLFVELSDVNINDLINESVEVV